MDTGFLGGFFGWLFGKEEEHEEDQFYCKFCGKEISEEEYEKVNGLCKECFGK